MRAIIIDDQPDLRENLRTFIAIYTPEIAVIAEGGSVKEGITQIQRYQPELVFLDIEMQDGTGFDLLSMLKDRTFKVIFVTSHDKYAIKAFKFSALDYLMKPIDPDELIRAVEKAIASADQGLQINTLMQNHSGEKPKKLVLKDSTNTYLINFSDLVRCESDVNYTRFFLNDGRKILVSQTLKSYSEVLEDFGFFRSHQSHLINLDYFDRYDRSEGGMIHLKTGEQIPVSTRKKDELIKALSTF